MKVLRRYATLVMGGFLLGLLPIEPKFPSHVYGQNTQLPQEYIPNYQIAKERQDILDMFVQIQAVKNTGLDLDEDFFKKLGDDFNKVFPSLPQESKFKVTYEQCRILTNNLAQEYTFNKFGQFLDSCFSALDRDIKEMNAKYSVQAKIKVNPQVGSAPLSVTFDARDSSDPSNETLPSNNYYWYYKDTNGVDQAIGQGAVVNHTFDQEGNYIVHLTVRSANQKSKGTLDGATSTTINVGPEAANIVVFANGQRLREDNIAKIGTAEAQNGVFIDASATVPKGGRIIQSHTREVKGGNNTLLKETNNGKPDAIQVKFPDEGQFSVSLSTTDNENNTVKKVFSIVIADPLALIRSNPENGNTSTTFSFDATSSYSLISKLRLYTWEIFDPSGEKVDTIQGKQISKKFSQPGNYAIKLTVEDEQGRKNTETRQLFVESTAPIPQFSINPLQDRSSPSQFELDAGLSNDIDILGANDSLDYQRDFSPLEYVKVDEIIDNGRKLIVTFNQKGNYDIKLTVSDQFGKLSEITKKLEVKSSLRPEMYISPVAGFRGNNVKFLVRANKPVVNYEWDLGDGTKRSILENKLIYSYDKVGVYPVTLTVYGPDDEKNSITRNVYVGETGKPIIAYTVKSRSNVILKQEDSCFDGATEMPAYRVPRLQSMLIDVAESVNTKGEKTNLQYYFQPQNDNIYKSNNFNYKFVELGCQRVDITVEDTQVHATHTQRVWFKVVNDLPVLQNIQMTFPQFGNQVGVGLSQGQEKQVFDGSSIDPLIVHVVAANARDPDGAIAFFKWYYFNKDNPDRILETKITPANVPEAYFSLQKIPGEYEFGVTLVDNDGGEQKSRSLIGNGPVVFFPPDSTNIDIPIVTLRQSEVNARIGDEITFEVVAKILSDRSDFELTRSIKYDFDGDGEVDLTTKESKVTYYYKQAGQYTPRVKVVYRGIPGSAVGEKIVVEDGIKPIILLENLGQLLIGRDISLGTNVHTALCMDRDKCGLNLDESERDPQYIKILSGEDKTFDFVYPSTGEYNYEMLVVDDFANQAVKTGTIIIGDMTGGLEDIALLSIPKAQRLNGGYSITVGSNLDNSILYYIANPLQGECFVDTDITLDSDGDGDPEQDRNIECNKMVSESYEPLFDSQAGRIYYQKGDRLETVDLTITFLDKTMELDEKLVPIYKDITSLILSLDASDSDIQYLKDLLVGLRNQLGDKVGVAAQVISIRDHAKNIENKLTEKEINRLDVILYALSDSTVTAALGGTPYEQAKQDILLLVPIEIKQQLTPLFLTIDNAEGDKDLIKETLQNIIDIVKNNAGDQEGQIDPLDLDLIVLPKICQILTYYDIASKACSNQDGDTSGVDTQNTEESGSTGGSSVRGKIFKIILIIVVVLGVVFGALVGIFAIKAKLAQKSDENNSESSGAEPTSP